MKIATYTQFGGTNWETASLTNILHCLGVKNPVTGKPYSEAMLLGIGGGLGGGYMLYEVGSGKHIVLGFRHAWQRYRGEFSEAVCARLGVPIQARETGSTKAAEAELRLALQAGSPVLLTCAEAGLPHRGLPPELLKMLVYGVAVYGIEEEVALIDDRAAVPFRVPLADLRVARAAITHNKNRMLVFSPQRPGVGPGADARRGRLDEVCALSVEELRGAVQAGLREGLLELLRPPIKNFGLTAWERWADLLINPKDRKGWPQVFRDPEDLKGGLISAFRAIEIDAGGGGLRGLFADFLEEAAEVIPAHRALFAVITRQYRGLAVEWTAFSDALLPDRSAVAAELKGLLRQRHAIYRSQGSGAISDLRGLDDQIRKLRQQPLGLSDGQIADLRAELSQRMKRIALGEAEAVHQLRQIV